VSILDTHITTYHISIGVQIIVLSELGMSTLVYRECIDKSIIKERKDANGYYWRKWGMHQLDYNHKFICELETDLLSMVMGQVLLPIVKFVVSNQNILPLQHIGTPLAIYMHN
jgi:hypothetical protein